MENKKEDFQRGIYKLATLLLVAFISQSAFAQKQTITGRIIDINNEAIIGASILEKELLMVPLQILMVNSRSKFPQNQLNYLLYWL